MKYTLYEWIFELELIEITVIMMCIDMGNVYVYWYLEKIVK